MFIDLPIYFQKFINDYNELARVQSAITICAVSIIGCYVFGVFTQKFSWVDKIWSIIPFVYSSVLTHNHLFGTLQDGTAYIRSCVLTLLIGIWGIRLTFNFARKGGYEWSGEDYRWVIVQKWFPNVFLWELFHFGFICVYQNILLLLIALPVFQCSQSQRDVDIVDLILCMILFALIVLETLADQQQWTFQSEKCRLIRSKGVLTGEFKDGFIQSGLFKYSRHPNFFAEISIWFVVFFISWHSSQNNYYEYSLGAILLFLLFQGSTWLTESISASKYPKYKEYQKNTSMLIPLPSHKSKSKKN